MTNNFVFIGDSLTFGYGVSKNKGWVYRISCNIDLNVINKGINGDTTPSMLNRLYDDVTSYNPSHTFIMGGTNDLLSGRSVDSIIENIEEMINECSSINSKIYIGIPPCIIKEMANKLFVPSPFYSYCESSLPILREKLITLCNKNSISYLDFYNLTLKHLSENIFIDGIHLNFLGNTLMFDKATKVFNI